MLQNYAKNPYTIRKNFPWLVCDHLRTSDQNLAGIIVRMSQPMMFFGEVSRVIEKLLA